MNPTKSRSPTLPAKTIMILVLVGLLTNGCGPAHDENDEFLKELSRKQAAQHDSLLRQSESLAQASQQLVEADATARGELVEMQSRLQQEFEAERRSIDGHRDKLDDERRDIAHRRHRDPLIATAILQGVTLVIAALPFVLVLFLLRASRDEPDDVPLAELLVDEFSTDTPLLLPEPPQSAPTSLPSPDAGPISVSETTEENTSPTSQSGRLAA